MTNAENGQPTTGGGWANGITVKRLASGRYTWTVAVAARDGTLDAMRAAVQTARQIEGELVEVYGPPPRRPPTSKPDTPEDTVPTIHPGDLDNPFVNDAAEAAGRSSG
jgi:hypothetical protein